MELLDGKKVSALTKDRLKEKVEKLKQEGIKCIILSNSNKKDKVEEVAKKLDIEYIMFAKKPFKKGFKEAQKKLELEAKQIGVVRRPNLYRCNRSK